MIYCKAILHKAGLGDRLFPWARCRIFSYVNAIPMLAPIWIQLRVGTVLRSENDPRIYYDLFKGNPNDIHGLKKIYLELFSKKIPEPEIFNQPLKSRPVNNTLFQFKGPKGCFLNLNGWQDFLYNEIRLITCEKWLKKIDGYSEIPIGIHIRRGDFGKLISEGGRSIPIIWFINSLKTIRRFIGCDIKAYVSSDGKKEEIQEILNEPNVSLIKTGSAIGDLLTLSKSKVLIVSPSSFSGWASFLGQMPTIAHPGHSLTWFNLTNNSKGLYLGEFDPQKPNNIFLEQAGKILSG